MRSDTGDTTAALLRVARLGWTRPGEPLTPRYGLEPDEITTGASELPILVIPAASAGQGPL